MCLVKPLLRKSNGNKRNYYLTFPDKVMVGDCVVLYTIGQDCINPPNLSVALYIK